MCKRESQKAKNPMYLVGFEIFTVDCFAGLFPWETILLVSFRFALKFIRFPRKTELLLGAYMLGCLHSGSQAGEKMSRETQHSLRMVSLFGMILLMSNVYALLPLSQRLSHLSSLENHLPVFFWDWERTIIWLLRVGKKIWGSDCILNRCI